MPAIRLPGLNGGSIDLVAEGLPRLVNFWATWCRPCRSEMAGLDRLHRDYSRAGLEVLGVSVDSDSNLVREFVFQERIAFPILLDDGGRITLGALGVSAFPTTVLVGRDGIVAEIIVGERDWDAVPIRERVVSLL